MKLQAILLSREELNEWNDFIADSPQYSIYLNSWYLDSLNKKYKILVAKNETGEIQGGIVLMKNELKMYSNPLLCKYLGICFKNFKGNEYTAESARRDVLNELLSVLKKYKTFDYTFHPAYKNWLNFYWMGYNMRINYTYRIDFGKFTLEQIRERFHGKLRSEIKYAEKQGYLFQKDIPFDLFYEVLHLTYKRQGGPIPYKKIFLKSWYERLHEKKAVDLFGVFNGDTCMAVAGILKDDQTANFLFNGINHLEVQRAANEYLVHEIINFYSDQTNIFDFEGSMLKPVESFYRKFGGELTPYYRIWAPGILNLMKQTLIVKAKNILYGK